MNAKMMNGGFFWGCFQRLGQNDQLSTIFSKAAQRYDFPNDSSSQMKLNFVERFLKQGNPNIPNSPAFSFETCLDFWLNFWKSIYSDFCPTPSIR